MVSSLVGFSDLPRRVYAAIAAMGVIVLASNILVQYPFTPFGLENYLTWGAFTYPFAFLVTDVTTRLYGAPAARRVVGVGFIIAVVLSYIFATPRIAVASGSAFLVAQMLDVFVFDRLRQRAWWIAPLLSTLLGAALDTAIFFTGAFAGDPTLPSVPYDLGFAVFEAPVWMGWAVVDYAVKLGLAASMLIPFRLLVARTLTRG